MQLRVEKIFISKLLIGIYFSLVGCFSLGVNSAWSQNLQTAELDSTVLVQDVVWVVLDNLPGKTNVRMTFGLNIQPNYCAERPRDVELLPLPRWPDSDELSLTYQVRFPIREWADFSCVDTPGSTQDVSIVLAVNPIHGMARLEFRAPADVPTKLVQVKAEILTLNN